ncbi:hypothetical protein B0J14DRAFT_580648 [Halenospora varia]|nr:hypothetical protein B0J14DRAFT_580648 [Halenospora varia]
MSSKPTMLILKFFQKRKSKTTSDSSAEASPPSYSSDSGTQGRTQMKAFDIPQWIWSVHQCREWIVAVLTTHLDFTHDDAEYARSFNGFGARLYGYICDEWKQLLGYDEGWSVFYLLLSMRHKKGAVLGSVAVPDDPRYASRKK